MSNFSWLKIKKPFLCLAPLAGISDSPFRQIAKNFGADLVFTEMVSAKGLVHNSEKTFDLMRFTQKERPIILQLFGKEPRAFAKAAEIIDKLKDSQKPDGLDLNLGCPARKVKAHGSGVSLMKKPKLVNQIIEAIVLNTGLPLSIKIRAGIAKEKITASDFISKINWQKLSAITIHGRTLGQGFSGPIDYQQIKKVKQGAKGKIIIANGGICDSESAKTMLRETDADGLMIGQAAFGNPWVFSEIKYPKKSSIFRGPQVIKKREKYQPPALEDKTKIALKHTKLMIEYKGEEKGVRDMRKHLLWYFKAFQGARKLRKKLTAVSTYRELKSVLSILN